MSQLMCAVSLEETKSSALSSYKPGEYTTGARCRLPIKSRDTKETPETSEGMSPGLGPEQNSQRSPIRTGFVSMTTLICHDGHLPFIFVF